MEVDNLLKDHIGEMGVYQIGVLFMVGSAGIFNAVNSVDYIFIAAVPDFWCNDADIGHLLLNFSHSDLQELVSPMASDKETYDSCQVYDRNFSLITYDEAWKIIHNESKKIDYATKACRSWVYSKQVFEATIISQWDLVCDKYYLAATSQSFLMAGAFTVILGGYLSDRFGRRRSLIAFVVMSILARLTTGLAPNFTLFVVGKFAQGVADVNWYSILFVICIEVVGPRWRVFAGQVPYYAWSVGYASLAGVAYLINDWRKLSLALLVFGLPYLTHICLLPESLRWLASTSKHEEASRMVKKIAKINKKVVSDSLLILVKKTNVECHSKPKEAIPWKKVLRSKILLKNLLILSYIWLATSTVYNGLVYYLPTLGGNIYVSTFLAGLLEIPALIYVQLTLDTKLGRRLNTVFTFFLSGATLLALMAIPKGNTWLILSLALIGRFSNAATFSIIYVYTTELYPTILRAKALSASSMCARVGGVIAPYMALMATVSKFLPPIIFGILSIIAGFLALLLPETRGRNLPDSLQCLINRTEDEINSYTGKDNDKHTTKADVAKF